MPAAKPSFKLVADKVAHQVVESKPILIGSQEQKIAAISTRALSGKVEIDARGLVIAPGLAETVCRWVEELCRVLNQTAPTE